MLRNIAILSIIVISFYNQLTGDKPRGSRRHIPPHPSLGISGWNAGWGAVNFPVYRYAARHTAAIPGSDRRLNDGRIRISPLKVGQLNVGR